MHRREGVETAATFLEEEVGRDYRVLDSEAEAMGGALDTRLSPRKRWVALSWSLRGLSPALELHFRKEREALFPTLHRILGEGAGAVTLLEESQHKLRQSARHLAELAQDPANLDWDRICMATQGFLFMLDEHRELEQRLLLRPLEAHASAHELERLAAAFHRAGERAHEEEGWPRPGRAAE